MKRLEPLSARSIHSEEDDISGLRIRKDATEREPREGVDEAA